MSGVLVGEVSATAEGSVEVLGPGEAATADEGSVEGSGDGSMLRGSLFVVRLSRISSVVRSSSGGGGAVSGTWCLDQSLILLLKIVCWTPSRMVVRVVLSIIRQSEHLEGGRENVSEGRSSETGSKAVLMHDVLHRRCRSWGVLC